MSGDLGVDSLTTLLDLAVADATARSYRRLPPLRPPPAATTPEEPPPQENSSDTQKWRHNALCQRCVNVVDTLGFPQVCMDNQHHLLIKQCYDNARHLIVLNLQLP
jgi:hypothetical protein